MKVYLDICAIKRPWDDQRQPRIAAETAIAQAMLRMAAQDEIAVLRSPAHDEENARNTDAGRAASIAAWLDTLSLPTIVPASLPARARALCGHGLTAFDALHLAWAEALGADLLVTTDDRFARRAARPPVAAAVPVVLPAAAMDRIARSRTP